MISFPQIRYFFSNYGHFTLFIVVCLAAINQMQKPKTVSATISCEKIATATLAISKQGFDHYNYKQLPTIAFESPFCLTDKTYFEHNGWSAWYEICFDQTPQNLTIDFHQYGTVVCFDENKQSLNAQISESQNNTPRHLRHIFFDLPKSDKVAHLTLQTSELNRFLNDKPQSFTLILPYENQLLRFELTQYEVLTDDFEVLDAKTGKRYTAQKGLHYRGVLQNAPLSIAPFYHTFYYCLLHG